MGRFSRQFYTLVILQAGSLVWSTYTVLDVEVRAVHNQESDHLVTIQSHGVVQRGISFLEKQSEHAEGGPEDRGGYVGAGLGSNSKD